MQLLKNILYKFFEFQEKILRLRLSKTIGVKHSSRSKKLFSDGCTLDINSMAETEKQQLEEEINNILKTYEYEPLKVLEYIKNQGTAVIFTPDAKKILNPIGENEGLIYPAKGSKALYLSLAINKKPAFKTNEMFILSDGEINKYYFIYHFYNWYAFKHNIAGLDSESQELLKKYLFSASADTKELQLSEIYKLKDAIRQDKASLEFVIKLCRNYDGVKQALNKMKNEGSAKL
jgi:hypothetical protein